MRAVGPRTWEGSKALARARAGVHKYDTAVMYTIIMAGSV